MTLDKVVGSAEEAVADIPSGASLAVGGFGLCGIPMVLIQARNEPPWNVRRRSSFVIRRKKISWMTVSLSAPFRILPTARSTLATLAIYELDFM